MRTLIVVSAVLFLTGCVTESTEGATRIFTYESWVGSSTVVFSLIAMHLGWTLNKKKIRFGVALIIAGVIAGVFFAPSFFTDRATVSNEGFTLRTGIWGLTSRHEVPLDGLHRVRFTTEEKRGRRGRKRTHHFMVAEYATESKKLSFNNEVAKVAVSAFVDVLNEQQIEVLDQMNR